MSKKPKQQKSLRVMWSSNSVFSSSGYGNYSRLILYKMLEDGYKAGMQSTFGLIGGRIELDELPVFPQLGSPWGEDALLTHSQEFGSHVSFTCQDIFPLNLEIMSKVKNWIPITFIDGDPISYHTKARLNLATEIVSVSKFGHELLVKNGYASTYIPLSVDTKTLRPIDKKTARDRFKIPQDAFVFGMVAANKDNPSRKSFQEVLDAFTEVSRKYPKALLYIHTNLLDQNNGFPIQEYARHKGIADKVLMLDPHTMQFKLDRDAMAYLFSSFNCLLNPSNREGFGLSIVEAQACGVPVIVNNCQSMPELVGVGKVCKTGYARWTLAQYQPMPDISDLIIKMLEIIPEIAINGKEMSKKARQFAVDNYDNELVYSQYWKPYLEKLEKRYCK